MAATLCISNIPESTTEEDLKAYFQFKDLPLSEDHSTIMFTKFEAALRTTVSFFDEETCKRARSLPRRDKKLKNSTLSFNDEFLGITVLYDSAQAQFDIVALHGMNGHAFDSWEYRDGDGYSFMWIRDHLPRRLPNARIMVYGYDADALSDVSEGRIRTFAETFLERLQEKRKDATKNRPITFIGHSLGGLIIKQALIIAKNRSDHRYDSILDSVGGILFMGTPHRGLNGVDMKGFIKNFTGAFDAKVDMNEHEFVKEQRRDGKVLFDLTSDFQQLIAAKRVAIATLYEIKKTKFGKLSPVWIVDEQSAILGVARERKSAIDADHKNLCKFEDSTSNSLTSTISLVEELCKDALRKTTPLAKTPSPPAGLSPEHAEALSSGTFLALKLGNRICIAYSFKDKVAVAVYDEKWGLKGTLSKKVISSARLRNIIMGEGKISFVDENDKKVQPVEFSLNELKTVSARGAAQKIFLV